MRLVRKARLEPPYVWFRAGTNSSEIQILEMGWKNGKITTYVSNDFLSFQKQLVKEILKTYEVSAQAMELVHLLQ